MSSFDAVAPSFDRHRALPAGAAEAVRAAVLSTLAPRPRLLDVGAGSGRIGWPFVAANDDYVGVDLSFGMLRAFKARAEAVLVQADGRALPFREATFDGVLLVQIFGALKGWATLIDEACRVLRPGGALMLGRTRAPDDGVDAAMKRQLAVLLGDTQPHNTRNAAERRLEELASSTTQTIAAQWPATRTPRDFLDRHAGGARFSQLPQVLRDNALRALAHWAVGQFGGLDASFSETHCFELCTYRFAER